MLSSYIATRAQCLAVVAGVLVDSEGVRQALSGCPYAELASKTAALLSSAATSPRPDWYRPHPHDLVYICTLASGEVLTWTQISPDEPNEIMAWTDPYQGTRFWREPLDVA